MKWKMILFVLSLNIAFSACEKKDISVFSTDDTGIYFQMIRGARLLIQLDHARFQPGG